MADYGKAAFDVAQNNAKQISGIVNIKQYEQLKSGTDWKPAIIASLDYLKSIGGGTLNIPSGVFTTSPLDLRAYKNIKIAGCGLSQPWSVVTTIKFISSGEVGIQFSETVFPNTSYSYANQATDCILEDLVIECDNKVNVGVNANYSITLRNITVRRAIQDGIILEDYTYPVFLDKVESSFNGRHGLYARGNMTTKYFANRCEFSNNNGYGMYIEGGATSTFQDCLTQSNKRGGVKLFWNGDSNPNSISYVENLIFINHYFEANGTLSSNDPNYEGNYGLVITSTNKTSAANKKPRNIRFIQGALNASSQGKTYLIDSVYGLYFDGLQTDHSKGSIPTPTACHSMVTSIGASSADNAVNAPYPFITSYGVNSPKNVPFLYYKGGVMGSRGRTQLLTFYVTNITAGQTVNMNIPLTSITGLSNLPNGFPLLQDSSILATELYKQTGAGVGGRKGTLTAQLCYSYISDGTTPSTAVAGVPSIVLDTATTNRVKTQYTPLQINLDTSFMIGFKLTASADYVPGTDTSVVLYVLLEN